jgi:tRNA1Val (adenine37-N6)-methyltransferase
MHNSFFRFKQFVVHQDRSAMKVGTDGVLLGAWTEPGAAKRILDVGCGTGLLSLMLAQRSMAIITGIDIDADSVQQAMENGMQSPWKERLHFQHASFQKFYEENQKNCPDDTFDLIISNPPFHPEDIKPADNSRRLARHSDELKPEEILELGKSLLSPVGLIAMIIPDKIAPEFLIFANHLSLYPVRILNVRPTPSKAIHRVLVEFSRIQSRFESGELIIEINGRHEYSREYRDLTRAFYLNF